jgi:outer membrane protein assembly factor BamB
MSAEDFIAELERRGLLGDRQLAKLRETVAGRPLTAQALAEFLVQKKLLSPQLKSELLHGEMPSDADRESALDLAAAETDVPAPGVAGIRQFDPIHGEGSSVFDSHALEFPVGRRVEESDDADLELAPLDEDADKSKQLSSEELLPAVEEPEPVTLQPVVEQSRRRLVSRDPGGVVVEDRLDDLPQSGMKPTALAERTPGGDRKKSKLKKYKQVKKKHWDSPLILLGGGGLILLVVCGAAVWWLMNRESSDQQLTLARAALDSGAYPQAIEHYQAFLNGTSRHPERSRARVQLAMVRVRQLTEGGDFSGALETAQSELKQIEDEPDFKEANAELAALLPQIALGLAGKAEQAAPGSEDVTRFVTDANKAVELCNNVDYVPKTLRDEGKLTTVRETLAQVDARQRTHFALTDGLKKIDAALAAAKPIEAYAVHKNLIAEHPELTGDASLAEAVKKTTAADQASVRFENDERAAETAERATPWLAALSIANRRVQPSTAPAGTPAVACVRIESAVYGVDVLSGRLLWRRQVGNRPGNPPLLVDSDVLVEDTIHSELLRLNAATGKLVWRQALGAVAAPPLIAGARVYVPNDAGRLFVIELATGKRLGYIQFGQPLKVAPASDRQNQRLYLAGDQGALYTISLADFSCLGAYYLGHAPGAIRVPPTQLSNKVVVIEHDGVETSRLRLLALDAKGMIARQEAERRQSGLATSQPIVAGRALVVTTDRGEIDVYDIGAGDAKDPLKLVATREATGSEPVVRHVALVGRNIWIGDTQLTKYSIVPAGNRLPVEEIENNFAGATFDHALAVSGNALVSVHRPKGRAGLVVAATDVGSGRTLWETDLAVPPAGAPMFDPASKALVTANAAGFLFHLDENSIRARVADQPLPTQATPNEMPTLTASADLGQGRAVFSAPGSDKLLHYNPSLGASAAKWIELEGPLACPVTPLGDGFVAPLSIGQVFLLKSSDAARAATPFQPTLEPGQTVAYQPAAPVGSDGRRFVVSNGRDTAYLVALVDQPQPHLEKVVEANVGPNPIETALVPLGDAAFAVAGDTHLVRFKLPTLESAGETNLPAPVIAGPFAAGKLSVLATADGKLVAYTPGGDLVWQTPIEHGDLAGPPLAVGDSLLLAYRKGVVERRSLADGKSQGTIDLEHALASGPAPFLQRFILSANDGTILVFNQP